MLPVIASLAVHVALAAGATILPRLPALRPLDVMPVELVVSDVRRPVADATPTPPTLIAAPKPVATTPSPPKQQPSRREAPHNRPRTAEPAHRPAQPTPREAALAPPVAPAPTPVTAVPAESPAPPGAAAERATMQTSTSEGSLAAPSPVDPRATASGLALPGPAAPTAVASVPPDAGVTRWARPTGGYQVRPSYPSIPKRLGIQGTALLRVHVLADGRVGDVAVEQSAGHRDLDDAAIDAVRRWRFEPARRGDDPVAMWVRLPVEFRLR